MMQTDPTQPHSTPPEGEGYELSEDPDVIAKEHHDSTNYVRQSLKPRLKTEVDTKKFCRKCGYNLFGLRSGGCPECGRKFDAGDPATYSHSPHAFLDKHSADLKAILYPALLVIIPVVLFYALVSVRYVLGVSAKIPTASEFIKLFDTLLYIIEVIFFIFSPVWAGFTFYVTKKFTTPHHSFATNMIVLVLIAFGLSLPFFVGGALAIGPLVVFAIAAIFVAGIQEWQDASTI